MFGVRRHINSWFLRLFQPGDHPGLGGTITVVCGTENQAHFVNEFQVPLLQGPHGPSYCDLPVIVARSLLLPAGALATQYLF